MNSHLSPVILFVYNRPWHTRQTIEALKNNILSDQTKLFVYSDGARDEQAAPQVLEVREYLKTISGFKKISIIERDSNYGLANNIIDGVTSIINQYGSAIILEDDLITSPLFLQYMNDALKKYKKQQNVYAISGYSFAEGETPSDSTYFLTITSSWSWATWHEKWSLFSKDETELRKLVSNTRQTKDFNFGNSYDYTSMAHLQLNGKVNSWAIFWYMSIFKYKGLTLFPAERLVRNIGYDGSGTHCKDSQEEKELNYEFIYTLTNDIFEKSHIRKTIQKALLSRTSSNFFKRLLLHGKSLFNHIKRQSLK